MFISLWYSYQPLLKLDYNFFICFQNTPYSNTIFFMDIWTVIFFNIEHELILISIATLDCHFVKKQILIFVVKHGLSKIFSRGLNIFHHFHHDECFKFYWVWFNHLRIHNFVINFISQDINFVFMNLFHFLCDIHYF